MGHSLLYFVAAGLFFIFKWVCIKSSMMFVWKDEPETAQSILCQKKFPPSSWSHVLGKAGRSSHPLSITHKPKQDSGE